ncbi:hypothetical protein DFJ73DRAFT_927421, partial [Zopfochytrium polystomum]
AGPATARVLPKPAAPSRSSRSRRRRRRCRCRRPPMSSLPSSLSTSSPELLLPSAEGATDRPTVRRPWLAHSSSAVPARAGLSNIVETMVVRAVPRSFFAQILEIALSVIKICTNFCPGNLTLKDLQQLTIFEDQLDYSAGRRAISNYLLYHATLINLATRNLHLVTMTMATLLKPEGAADKQRGSRRPATLPASPPNSPASRSSAPPLASFA